MKHLGIRESRAFQEVLTTYQEAAHILNTINEENLSAYRAANEAFSHSYEALCAVVDSHTATACATALLAEASEESTA